MTRGQESLLGSEEAEVEAAPLSTSGEVIRMNVRVLPASEEELALHVAQIADIDKASKGACVWKHLEEHA
jgi:DNA polymerase-3 subunit epsilon